MQEETLGGFFGVVSEKDCVADLYYGTDYHSHLGTWRGGMVVKNKDQFKRSIHDITNTQFRSKFEDDLSKFNGHLGIGVINDTEAQPLIIRSHHGNYALVTVGRVINAEKLIDESFTRGAIHFSEISGARINSGELVATLINREDTIEDGIELALESVDGSCSLLLLTEDSIYAARDRLGRTPVIVGRRKGARAVTMETCALPNLGFEIEKYLGPGEIVRITSDGFETLKPAGDKMQICAFLWVYYGYPASSYEGINVEVVRYRCGAALARADDIEVDYIAGIPDSGTGHALGYSREAGIPYSRPFVKYTPTWPRSFMPTEQRVRDLVAKMKLIPINELIQGKRLLFCEDSIVRGTQLKDTIQRLYDCGAMEVHMRPACPPLIFSCPFINFSQSKSEYDLAGRRAIKELEGESVAHMDEYSNPDTEQYGLMVDRIRQWLRLTTLKYQRLPDLVSAIGLPKEKLCTFCWDGTRPY